MSHTVLYLSHAPEAVYDIIRGTAPAGYELVTLREDSDAERLERIRDAEVVIVAAYPLTRAMLDAARRLRLVHHQGVGYQDTVDWQALAARGIPLALTPAGTTIGVAEHTVLLILAAMRRLPFADSELRLGRWHINALRPVSRELAGCTVGYIGMGRIAQAVAERLRPFGTQGLYHDVVPLSGEREAALGVRAASRDEVLSSSDVVTLHAPATPATRHIIDARAIRRMKRDAFLINTARGSLVDEAALAEALREGRLAGAGLDVFEKEPPTGSPLLDLPNIVLTPHISAGTRDALAQKMRAVFENVQRFYRGEALENEVKLTPLAAREAG
ncbi:MAG TPA: 2-hydroxyacid dehydrogenase [Alphaproteobacteria bacterium]|nr:2-hydroxyacid dehydrogenase [Alphaproteobacteria bacterium]